MEQKKLFIKLAFVGTDFCGYQVQPNGRTVQSELNRAALELFGKPCDIVGCSRTDSGVHANEFCATVTFRGQDYLETNIRAEKIPLAFSAHLPPDISVFDASFVPTEFHARYSVVKKEYIYRIYNARTRSPFEVNRAFHYPKYIDATALEKMALAAGMFVGTHDFTSFMTAGTQIRDTVRTVYQAEVFRTGDIVCFRVSANGFLYNMVRIMTGTLLEVAENKIKPEDVPDIISAKNRELAGMTAPPEGLYLNKVTY